MSKSRLLVMLCAFTSVRSQDINEVKSRILPAILEGYNRAVRPTGTNSEDGPVIVETNFFLRALEDIDDHKMEMRAQLTFRTSWNDQRLMFDDGQGSIKYLTVMDSDLVWKPDIFFVNSKETQVHDAIGSNEFLRIYPNGDVRYSIRVTVTTSCPMNFRYFPFDRQLCSIMIASYGFSTDDLVLEWSPTQPVALRSSLTVPGFTLEDFSFDHVDRKTNTGTYTVLRTDFQFERQSASYVMYSMIPSIMFVLISWFTFWMKAKMRSVIALVCLVSTSVLKESTAKRIPVDYTTSMDVFEGICVTFIFLALLVVVFADWLNSRKRQQNLNNSAEDGGMTSTSSTTSNKLASKLEKFKFLLPGEKCDVISRVVFPAAYILFLIIYFETV